MYAIGLYFCMKHKFCLYYIYFKISVKKPSKNNVKNASLNGLEHYG
jgi:hypothetical protein